MTKPVSSVTLLKLGGALFTDKTREQTIRPAVLARIIAEIKELWPEYAGQLIIGHGQGSFAHLPAQQFQTTAGFTDREPEKRLGAAVVHNQAAQLNRIVVQKFIQQELPAVTWLASSVYSTEATLYKAGTAESIKPALQAGLLPITGGDVMFDAAQKVCIWSTESVFEQLVIDLQQAGVKIKQVLYVTEVAGLLDVDQKLVPQVSEANWPTLQQAVGKTKGIDVTGGMKLKMEHCLRLAKLGVPSKILSGLTPGNIKKALQDTDWVGTRIEAVERGT